MSASPNPWLFATHLAAVAVFAAGNSACLDDPELPACSELPPGTEGCEGTCTEYCDTVLATGCDDIYPSRQNCLDTCALLPLGDSDADANTVACRIKYARMAALEPDPQACDAASAGGGGACGDVCEIYCDFVGTNCTDGNAVYDSRATCLDTCNLMDTFGFHDDWVFTTEADSVQCRLYHAGPPAAAQPEVHCPHTAVYNDEHCGIMPGLPEQPVGWPCPTFCEIVLVNCPGVYNSATECQADCRTFPEVVNLLPGEVPAIFPLSSTTCPN